jgi:hypothetical protein
MNGAGSNLQVLFHAYMSLIWWINGVVCSLFALDWVIRHWGHRLDAWLESQRQSTRKRIDADTFR